MIQTIRERLTLLLIALLPFHAFLVTVLTKMIEGPGHAPIGILALWKEALLGLILCLCFVQWIRNRWVSRTPATESGMIRFDAMDWLIVGMIVLSVLVTALTHGDWKLYLFGFKYDFIPLVAFLILRRVEWSKQFQKNLQNAILGAGFLVILFALVSRLLPLEFFVWLGYSDLHSLYLPGAPLAAFQMIGDTDAIRVQGPMSGPNQLGLWMLIPFSFALVQFSKSNNTNDRWRFGSYTLMCALVLLYTYSRSAWIAAAVIAAIALRPFIAKYWKNYIVLGPIAIVVLVGLSAMFVPQIIQLGPDVILRFASSRDHIARPLAAIRTIIEHPLGLGLGTAGPASNRLSDACVYLAKGSDPSWAADRPDLCVFVGDTQVQPISRTCQCPFLPENWYLQIGVELGILGFALYIALIVMILMQLKKLSTFHLQLSTFLAFLGISIAALFLHAWEDSAVAYTLWILIASLQNPTRRI